MGILFLNFPSLAYAADTTPPEVVSITYDPGWKNTNVYKEVIFKDTDSGIKLIEYSYDQITWYSDWDSGSGGSVAKTWSGKSQPIQL